MRGWPVLRVWAGAVYVRIPRESAELIEDGCSCTYCKAHPNEPPRWDTLGIPIAGSRWRFTWTLHAPEWKVTDTPREPITPAIVNADHAR